MNTFLRFICDVAHLNLPAGIGRGKQLHFAFENSIHHDKKEAKSTWLNSFIPCIVSAKLFRR
ncbi:hypothetical protein, partial [Kluyvera sp.]